MSIYCWPCLLAADLQSSTRRKTGGHKGLPYVLIASLSRRLQAGATEGNFSQHQFFRQRIVSGVSSAPTTSISRLFTMATSPENFTLGKRVKTARAWVMGTK